MGSYDPSRHSSRQDLAVEAPGLQFTQKWAKNRQQQVQREDLPRIPPPHFQGDPLDPVQAYLDLQNHTPTAGECDPLLIVPTPAGGFYTLDQRKLRQEFHRALITCDLDPKHYTPHSLRRGGATLLHQQGASVQDIKRQGLWRSDAVNAYLSDHALTQSSVISSFTGSVNPLRDEQPSTSRHASPPCNRSPQRRFRHRPAKLFKKGPNAKNKHSFCKHGASWSNPNNLTPFTQH